MALILRETGVTLSPFDSVVRAASARLTMRSIKQDQLQRERAQHRFNFAQKESELALVLLVLAEVRLELARRDTIEALARAPSPSAMLH